MEIKELRCKVCNHPLNIAKENVYVANVTNQFFNYEKKYDAVDCPYCGCQNLLNDRYERKSK